MADQPLKNVLITGSSQRVGRSIAEKLARMGWNVAIHYFNSKDEAEHLTNQLAKDGIKAVPVRGN
ncbi:MAG: SDR family NAD(P)-dependent oxidoreductase, partial [Rhodospirillaceae bacterium]